MWLEDRRLVLFELKRIATAVDKTNDKIDDKHTLLDNRISKLHTEVITLKVKSSTWGAIGGGVLGFLVAVLFKIFG